MATVCSFHNGCSVIGNCHLVSGKSSSIVVVNSMYAHGIHLSQKLGLGFTDLNDNREDVE